MQVTNGEALLAKYNLKANDAVLAEGNQAAMYVLFPLSNSDEAGGTRPGEKKKRIAANVSFRQLRRPPGQPQGHVRRRRSRPERCSCCPSESLPAPWFLRAVTDVASPKIKIKYVLPDGATAYLGAVGSDALAEQLRAANEKEGLLSAYQVVADQPTGACAVVITGHDR